MIVDRDKNTITITLEAPWESEVADYLWEQYGPLYLRNFIVKMFLNKDKGREYLLLREEMSKRNGN